jgi:hypothetical protein
MTCCVTAYALSGNDQIILTCSHTQSHSTDAVREPPKDVTFSTGVTKAIVVTLIQLSENMGQVDTLCP